MKVQSECGAANLLAAIKQRDPERVRYKLGLPSKYHPCLQCNSPTMRKMFCTKKCLSAYRKIMVECSGCGRLFPLRQSELIGRTKRHLTEKIYCSRECSGRRAGREYGFATHPENCGHKKPKYTYQDKAKVRWLKRLGLTWNEISETTGIPYGSCRVLC